MAKGAAAGGGGFLSSPLFGALLGAAGTPSGGNAGAAALAGMSNATNMQRSQAGTQLIRDQSQSNEELNKFLDQWQQTLKPGEGLNAPQPAAAMPPQVMMPPQQPQVMMMPPSPPAAQPMLASPPVVQPAPVQQGSNMPQAARAMPPSMGQGAQSFLGAAAPPAQAPAPMQQPAPRAAPLPASLMRPGGMLGSQENMGPLLANMMRNPATRNTALQGLLAMNKPGAGAETWSPATAAQRGAYGAPPTGVAQVSSGGKMQYTAPSAGAAGKPPATKEDANGILRYLGGDKHGERVYPDVTKEKEFDFKDERSLAKEATANIKPIREAVTSIKQITKSLARTGPFSDIASLYGLIKAIDPGSVVREGEVHIVTAAQGIFQQLEGQMQKAQGLGFLTPELKANISETVGDLASIYEQQYKNFTGHYTDISKQYSFDPGRVIGAPVTFLDKPDDLPD